MLIRRYLVHVAPAERTLDAPKHWPAFDELKQLASPDAVIMLPDRLETDEGKLVAAFRLDAQGLRVAAKEAGLSPVLYAPPGAELAMYTENAANWVLPVIVAAVLAVPGQIGATLAADWIEAQSPQHAPGQTVLYREAVIDHGSLRLCEVEGAPSEVVQVLRDRCPAESPRPVPPDEALSELSPTPPDHLGR